MEDHGRYTFGLNALVSEGLLVTPGIKVLIPYVSPEPAFCIAARHESLDDRFFYISEQAGQPRETACG